MPTNRMSVIALHIFWKAISSHLFPWLTVCVWHCTFSEKQSHDIIFYDQQRVSEIAHFVKVVHHSHHLFLWLTASEWHHTSCEKQSYQIFFYDKQEVSHIAHFVKGSVITSSFITNSLWVHCTFCETQSYHIFSYDKQLVGDNAKFSSLHSQSTLIHEWLIYCYILCTYIRKWACCHISSHFFLIWHYHHRL